MHFSRGSVLPEQRTTDGTTRFADGVSKGKESVVRIGPLIPGQWISGASPLNFRKLIYLPANYQVINLVRRWFSFLEGEIRRLALIFLILSLEELSINQVINRDLKRFRPCLPFACCNTLRRGTHCCSLISYPIT